MTKGCVRPDDIVAVVLNEPLFLAEGECSVVLGHLMIPHLLSGHIIELVRISQDWIAGHESSGFLSSLNGRLVEENLNSSTQVSVKVTLVSFFLEIGVDHFVLPAAWDMFFLLGLHSDCIKFFKFFNLIKTIWVDICDDELEWLITQSKIRDSNDFIVVFHS